MFLFFVVFPFFQQKMETETGGPKMELWKHWVLATWLHAGYRMTYNLVTGSRSMAHLFADSDEVFRFL